MNSRHVPGFTKLQDVEVVAVCNCHREAAEAVAKEWNVPHVMDTPTALLGRDDINLVLIETTAYMHRDLTLAALEAHKHALK